MTCIKTRLLGTRLVRFQRFHVELAPVVWLLMIGLLLLALPSVAQTRAQGRLLSTPITAGMHLIDAELAISESQQATGMMYRTRMGANEGMLFVNQEAGLRCFWMRNTLLPLSIAFVEEDGTIVNIAEMQAQSDESHCSARPVRYALEMNAGWFAKRGLQAGFKLRGKPFKP